MKIHAYVGSYGPNGEGLYSFSQDPASGALQALGLSPGPRNPSWLCATADGSRLFVANEHEDAEAAEVGSGEVTAYARDRHSGALTLIDSVASGGARPVHLSLGRDERCLFVANYGGGSVAVLPLADYGRLGAPSMLLRHADLFADVALGPQPAEQSCPGSFALSDHDGPHAHMAQLAPSGRHLLVSDLGLDLMISWRYDAGRLSTPQTLAMSPGAGPRHFAFHPQQGEHLYVLNEEASTLAWLHFDADSGGLSPRAELSSLPPGFKGTSFASDLRFSADGRHLYCLNRLHDSVAIFAVAADGSVNLRGHEWTRGSYPRSFAFDPSGRFLYVCNQRSDHLVIFEVSADGGLEFTGQYVAVGSPVAICFAAA